MLSCCLKCQKNIENVDPKMLTTKNGRTILSSKCVACGSKKSRFMKEQEIKGILSSLGLKTTLNKVSLFVDILI